MKPTKTLTEAQYQNLVYSLMNAPSWGDYLNGCEAEFLEVNRDFYPLLLHAIQRAKMPFYRDLNALLIANPGMKKDDISFPDLDRLKALEGFIRQRLEGEKPPSKAEALAPLLADKYAELWLLPDEERLPVALAVCRDLEARYQPGKWTDAAVLAQALEAHISELETEIQQFQARYLERLKRTPPTETYIDADTGEQRERPTPQPPLPTAQFMTFRNRVAIDFLRLAFLSPQAQGKPAPPAEAFGEDLAQMIREALEARGQLKEGRFTGNSTQVKALYNVLAAGGYLKGAYPHTRFAAFFLEYFAFRITGRTLQNPPNRGQDREEREYRQLLP